MSVKVRAIVFHAHGAPGDVVQVVSGPLPEPHSGEALVRVIAAPIHPADLNVIEGTYPVRPALPATLGIEGAARVERIGGDVKNVAPGDLVLLPHAFGSWREAGLVPAEDLLVVPRGIDPVQAAMLQINPPTALRMLRDFRALQAGDWVAQNAANSAVGRAVVAIAKAHGIRTLNVVRREELIDEMRGQGAEFVFLDDESLAERVTAATGGAGIRLAFNAVGGESALRLANILAPSGTLVTYGAMGRKPLRIPNGLLIFRDLQFRGFWLNAWTRAATPDDRAAMFGELFALAQRGVLDAPIERAYSLEAAFEALAHAQRGSRAGKIIFAFKSPSISS